MKFTLSYRKKIFIYFSVIIGVFTVGIIAFEQNRVKHERMANLENIMDVYAETVHRYISENRLYEKDSLTALSALLSYLPDDGVRLTVIDWQGNVMYDNTLSADTMENHLQRPEIQKAIVQQSGTHVRVSATNNVKYMYYAKKYDEGYFIRVALPYDIKVKPILHAKDSFVYYILLFFVVCVFMMNYFANRFSKSIKELREFSLQLKSGQPISRPVNYVDDEIGEISADIIENYNLLQQNRKQLALEREKLLQHFQYSKEGIAIFSSDRKKIYANPHFLQYLNVIADKTVFDAEKVFSDPHFSDVVRFLEIRPRKENIYTKRIEKSGKQFDVRVIVFDDESFEIYIADVTKQEKTRLLKQEMTNNIAHELRTPVTAIRGYIETLLTLDDNDVERRRNFLERAHAQTIRLSELIQDITLLTKIEEAPDRFEWETVNIKQLLEELKSDLEEQFKEKNDRFVIEVDEDVTVEGNRTLLYSIFRNLAENSLAYGGENIEIGVRCYAKTEDTLYFEFYDTGVGVDEHHLGRIFERFYRIDDGRTRNTGGSGLGLSIVKNAVLLHHGSIVAKNRPEGGLSFLITFPRLPQKNQ
ncbi:MAG TPA: ATP-binding protein [Dysgonamonadaceae bacterium]|nr:ATP-binding protein [Dysgonamonadaceae bacterium]